MHCWGVRRSLEARKQHFYMSVCVAVGYEQYLCVVALPLPSLAANFLPYNHPCQMTLLPTLSAFH